MFKYLNNKFSLFRNLASNDSISQSGLRQVMTLQKDGYSTFQQSHCNKSTEIKQTNPELYSWGAGVYGQLGIGGDTNKAIPQKVDELKNVNIIAITAKSDVSGALSKEGKVYTWGRARGGGLGHNVTTANILLPTMVEGLNNLAFTQLDAGQYHMAAITPEGHVYTWGNKEHGRLGHNLEEVKPGYRVLNTNTLSILNASEPKRVLGELENKSVVQVSCGSNHTICLTSDGSVYTWGSFKKGVLGYSSTQDIKTPTKVDALKDKKIIKVTAGPDFNYALTSEGKVYSWGSNDYGQLGNPSALNNDPPKEIPTFNEKINDFSCGDNFGAAISESGKLYTWGYGNEGSLGHGNKNDIKSPKSLEFGKKISRVSCGSGHTGFITSEGELYLFGRGREGQLGRADTIESTATYRVSPQLIETFKNRRTISVACGGDHTLALVL